MASSRRAASRGASPAVSLGLRTLIVALGVLLAAITTLLGFGLLAFSSTPAIASFGLTLFMGVVAAFFASPLARADRPLPEPAA